MKSLCKENATDVVLVENDQDLADNPNFNNHFVEINKSETMIGDITGEVSNSQVSQLIEETFNTSTKAKQLWKSSW